MPSYPQPHIEAKVTRRINKEEGNIVWEQSSKEIIAKILAYNPSPTAFTYLNGTLVKIHRARKTDFVDTDMKPGTVLDISSAKNGVFVQTGCGIIELLQVQFPGSKVLLGKDAINGRKLNVNDVLEYIDCDEGVKKPQILK